MSLEDFQLLDNETIDNSIIKRDYLKVYHQQAANLIDSDRNIEFIFGEINNYHQFGNAYLEYELKIEKVVAVTANRVLVDAVVIRLVNIAFAFCFKEARLSTTGGSDIDHNKYVGQVSTSMRALTSKERDLLSHFDKFDECRDEIGNISLHQHIISNHDELANKGKIKGHLLLEHFSWILQDIYKDY